MVETRLANVLVTLRARKALIPQLQHFQLHVLQAGPHTLCHSKERVPFHSIICACACACRQGSASASKRLHRNAHRTMHSTQIDGSNACELCKQARKSYLFGARHQSARLHARWASSEEVSEGASVLAGWPLQDAAWFPVLLAAARECSNSMPGINEQHATTLKSPSPSRLPHQCRPSF